MATSSASSSAARFTRAAYQRSRRERSSGDGFAEHDQRAPCIVLLDQPERAREQRLARLAAMPCRRARGMRQCDHVERVARELAASLLADHLGELVDIR